MSNAAKPKRSDSPAAKTVERDRNIDETMRSVSDELEEQIVLGVLNPRERLVEDDLCERFNLKRHVARQVLAEVERRGLVERRKNVGALVKSYTPREVTELYALRELLEADAARRIVFPVSSEALEALTAIQAEHDEAAGAGDRDPGGQPGPARRGNAVPAQANRGLVELDRDLDAAIVVAVGDRVPGAVGAVVPAAVGAVELEQCDRAALPEEVAPPRLGVGRHYIDDDRVA